MSYVGVPPFGQTVRTVTEVTAQQDQAIFYPTGGYLPGYIDVELDGSDLGSQDFTATDGLSVVLTQKAGAGDLFRTKAYWPVAMVDTMRRAEINGIVGAGGWAMRSRLINGDMRIDQRNAGASFTNSNTSVYGVDRWITSGLTSAVLTFQQVADAPAGYKNSFKCTVTTSTTANDTGGISQRVEANNAYDLMWGNSAGQTATLSFWVKASTTGTYCAVFTYFGGTATYYYVAPYTVTANTWTQVSLTIPAAPVGAGDFSGALNAQYLYAQLVTLGSSGNTTYATANTWSSTAAYKTSGSVNLASTGAATIQFTGVQLEKGSTATSFDYRPYGTELALCQRYYWRISDASRFPAWGAGLVSATTTARYYVKYPVTMRAVPTFSYGGTIYITYGSTYAAATAIGGGNAGVDSATVDLTSSGLTVGSGTISYPNSGLTNYVEAGAEL